jgi:hypothetical protein
MISPMKTDLLIRFVLGASLLGLGGLSASPVINEIFYHPAQPGTQLNPTGPEDITKEWLEIYNPDTIGYDLTGWTVGGGSVSFAFPNGWVLPAGGYVIVAADAATFHSAYPAVVSYLGNWTGELGNIADSVDLFDGSGVRVDHVHYDTEGDWAKMRNVTTLDPLGYPYGWIWLSDADGGGKSVELVNPNLKHNNGQNWIASTPAGGTPGADNSLATADTAPLIENVEHFPKVPTHLNLVTVKAQIFDEAPALSGVSASVKYRIPVSGAAQPAWLSVAMHDDGLTGDDIAGDGIYVATLPAQALGKLVEYYVEAKDAANHTRTWPAASDDTGDHNANALYQVDEEVNASTAPLYRILMTPNELAGWDGLQNSSSNRTSQRFLCTFLALANGTYTERQRATTRMRGSGSRGSATRSAHIDFLNAEPWQGNTGVNLNAQYTYLQFLGAQLAHASGIVSADAKPVQVRWNSVNRLGRNSVTGLTTGQDETRWIRNYGLMAHVEPINRDFIKHHYPTDYSGNLYTKRGSGGGEWAVAASLAVAPAFYAGIGAGDTGEGWEKQNNTASMNFSDLHNFVSTMTVNAAAPTASYLTNVGSILDVNQWLKTMAVSTILTNGETNLLNGRDDDYSMYAGATNSKFQVIFHDMDTILGLGDSSVITLADIQTAPGNTIYDVVEAGNGGDVFDKLVPLFNQPSVVVQYHQYLRDLLNGPFSKAQFDALVDRSLENAGWPVGDVPTIKIAVKRFMDGDGGANPIGRRQGILNKITPALAVTTGPAVVSGFPQTTTSAIPALAGGFDSTNASQVLINGVPASIDIKAGTWTNAGTPDTLIAAGDSWKYFDGGTDLGTTWTPRLFVDTGWAAGPAPLGYSPSNVDGAATIIGGANVANGQSTHFTNYFRKHFTVPNPGKYSGNITVRVQRDDGVVLYLNGTEIGREGMPTQVTLPTVLFNTPATNSPTVEDEWITFTFPAASLLTGDNVLAAEVHQNNLTSSDCRFNCEMVAGSSGAVLGGLTALNPGINRVTLEEKNAAGEHVRYTYYDIWYNDGTVATQGGAIAANTLWTAAGGPYLISSTLTIGTGVTLTIQPGTTVYTANGIGIAISGTGRLLAEGSEFQRIRFTRQPGGTALAGQVTATSSSESRFVWCDLEYYGGGVGIDCTASPLLFSHSTFTHTDVQYLSFHNSSFIVEDSYFETYSQPANWPPLASDPNRATYGRPEMLHGNSGIPTTGYAIFRRNLFGHTFGFNDVIDFTGGSQPNAILQFIDNIFVAATDDHLDLDNTDAWISGNVFLNAHADAARSNLGDSSSSISGGLEGTNTDPSEWTIYGNLFYNMDHAVLAKGKDGAANTRSARHAFLNNTVCKITGISPYFNGTTNVSIGQDIAVFNFSDNGALLPPASGEAGMLAENNIIWDTPALVANYDGAKLFVTMNDNLLPLAWTGPGVGNQVLDGALDWERFAELDYAKVDRESDYQRLWKLAHEIFAPCAGSPARGTGPGGVDKGGLIANGIQVSGAPTGTTAATGATLTLGPKGTFDPIVAGPAGVTYGFTAYKWSLDGGVQNADIPVATPIVLTGLTAGLHTVRVWGKNHSNNANTLSYQVAPTVIVWTVDPAYIAPVVINEVLATNVISVLNGTAHPDVIELFNPRSTDVDISGWAISDDAAIPAKFVFPATTTIPAGGYLVLFADAPDGNPGTHLGFSLDGDGENIVLSSPNGAAWTTVDSVTFGLQLPDKSIGRVGLDRHWDLNQPSLGNANVQHPNDCPGHVLFNEWLANSEISYKDDQIELYNTNVLPGNIGGFYLTDTPDNPLAYQFPPLSFVAGNGYANLIADGTIGAQANHLPFKLDAFYDWLMLTDTAGNTVDYVAITCAQPDVAEGRLPDGSATITTLALPTFGLTNVSTTGGGSSTTTTTLVNYGEVWKFLDTTTAIPANDGSGRTWQELNFTDTAWKSGGTPIGRDADLLVGGAAATVNPATGTNPFFTTDTTAAYLQSTISYYFRKTFTFSGNIANTTLRISRYLDDGYNLYLNGQRIDTKGTLTATPAWNTVAGINVGDASAENNISLTLPPGALIAGTNQLSAEVHQTSATSGDIVFAIKLFADETAGTPITITPERQRMMDLMDFLRITEVQYAPLNGANFEFVEVKNTSTTKTLDITGVRFTSGITYTFGTMSLEPGAFAVVAKTPSAFTGIANVVGPFAGRLDNSGEQIALTLPEPYSANIMCFTYESAWYPAAFGAGSSLQVLDPLVSRAAFADKTSWQASVNVGGSPGGGTAVFNFATWQTALSAPGANNDLDHDGLEHLLEYSLALDPKFPDTDKAQITASFNPTNTHMEGTFSLPVTCPADIRYLVQVGDQLTGWTTIATKTGAGAWSGTATVSTSTPSGSRVTVLVTDPDLVATHPRSFLRVKTELIP